MPHLPFVAGDIVSVLSQDGKYRILKILVVDELGLYTQLFAQQFTERPRLINISKLSTPAFGPVNFPVTHEQFALCKPEVIAYQRVSDEDLKDYRLWINDKGTYC